MRTTCIAYSKGLNKKKFNELTEQAKHLGRVRTEVWQRYGSISGVVLGDRAVRDQWLSEKKAFAVSANAWKESLRDSMGDIKANREAAKVVVRRAITRRCSDKNEKNRLYQLLSRDQWTNDAYLRRTMRKACCRGHNRTHNQIIVRSDNYTTFLLGKKAWIKIPGLEKGKRITIPLNTTKMPTSTLRLILRNDKVEVHYSVEVPVKKNCGNATIGIDKGYTEVYVDSEGEHHGRELGTKLSSESDYLKQKYQRRNRLHAIGKHKKHKKKAIYQNNLGRKKLNRRQAKHKRQVKDVIYKATHAIVDKAETIAAEDLTAPMCTRKFGKDVTRRLSAWVKGEIAKALCYVSQRRGSTLVLVNAAYTSQIDSRNGTLTGRRIADLFYCSDGEVLHADENAALNIQARLFDPEIDRWTPFKKVKSILLERTLATTVGTAQPGLQLQRLVAINGERIT